MELNIRKLNDKEINIFDAFLNENVSLLNETSEFREKIYKNYILDFYKKDKDYALAAELNGEIIGVGLIRYLGNYHYDSPSLKIYVKQNFRFNNIGTILVHKMVLELLRRKVREVNIIEALRENTFKFYKHIGFKVIGNNKGESLLSLDLNRFFRVNILEYDVSIKKGFKVENKPILREYDRNFRYSSSEMEEIVNLALDQGIIIDDGFDIKMENPFNFDKKKEIIVVENDVVKEIVINRKRDYDLELIKRAHSVSDERLNTIDYDKLLELRKEAINDQLKKIASKTQNKILSSKQPKVSKEKEEKLSDDENYERLIAKALKGMVYENVVGNLISNYQRLYKVSDTRLKAQSGISRDELRKIRKYSFNPTKKTILQICIGLTLRFEQGKTLMKAAGYVFDNKNYIDKLISTCLKDDRKSPNRVKTIARVNDMLVREGFSGKELFEDHRDYDPRKLEKEME